MQIFSIIKGLLPPMRDPGPGWTGLPRTDKTIRMSFMIAGTGAGEKYP